MASINLVNLPPLLSSSSQSWFTEYGILLLGFVGLVIIIVAMVVALSVY